MKKYKFEKKNDYIIYLRYIIASVYKQLYRHKKYFLQLNDLIGSRELRPKNIKIPEDIYLEINHKLLGISMQMLNLIGDHAKDAVSYKRFRQLAEDTKSMNLKLQPLPEDIRIILNELNTKRNWALHEAESLLNSSTAEENQTYKVDEEFFNPILIAHYSYYDRSILISIYNEHNNFREKCYRVFAQMKKDYSTLLEVDAIEIKWYEYDTAVLEDFIAVKVSLEAQYKK